MSPPTVAAPYMSGDIYIHLETSDMLRFLCIYVHSVCAHVCLHVSVIYKCTSPHSFVFHGPHQPVQVFTIIIMAMVEVSPLSAVMLATTPCTL